MAQEDKIGALWVNSNDAGKKWLTGVIEIDGKSQKVVVFQNGFKKEEKHPDYIIYKSKPKDGASASNDEVPF